MKNLKLPDVWAMNLLKWGPVLIIGVALFIGTYSALTDPSGPVLRYWNRYMSWLERKLRLMFIFDLSTKIGYGQIAALVLFGAAVPLVDVPLPGLVFVAIVVGPAFWVQQKRKKYIADMEAQLDSVMLALSNALKSTPSIGAAFASLVEVVESPFREEIDLALKEMKIGSSLDLALRSMSARIGSRSIDTALSTILIGRQVGGNLPKVLENTAGAIREMKRLDGVIRTKTADGKMQLWVIAIMPFGLILGLSFMWPGYFDPIKGTSVGYMLFGIAGTCWISAIVLARKVLTVDI
ncbi:MAG: type II secretion system F family protein [Polyangiaceae bacterium]